MERIYTYHNDIDLNNHSATGFLLETKFSALSINPLNDQKLIELIKKIHELNKLVYLRMDRVLLEEEVEELILKQDIYLLSDGIFFEDFAYITLFKNKVKLIFFPFESISSGEEINTLLKYGINLVIIPHGKEKLFLKENNLQHVGLMVSYPNILFLSRKKLLLLKYIDNSTYHLLKEDTRENHVKILETANGTIIYDKQIDLSLNEYPAYLEMLVFDNILKDVI